MESICDVYENKNDTENYYYNNECKLSLIQDNFESGLLSTDLQISRNNNYKIIFLSLLLCIIIFTIIIYLFII